MGYISMMMTIGLPACVVLYVYSFAFAPRWRRPVPRIVAPVVAVLMVACFASIRISRTSLSPDTWRLVTVPLLCGLALLLYLTMGLLVVRVVSLVWRVADRVRGAAASSSLRGLTPRVRFVRWATCLVLAGAVGVTSYGVVRAHHPVVTPLTFANAQVPAAFDGYRIALLSDLHIGPGLGPGFLRQVVDETNAARPDLIVIAGDLVDGEVPDLGPDMAALRDLSAPDGVLVTTGNHEFYTGEAPQWVQYFRSLGLNVLDNNGVVISRGGASIDVLGINDRTGRAPLNPDVQLAAQRLAEATGEPVDGAGRFRILIAHEPLQAQDNGNRHYVDVSEPGLPARLGVDLMLSGHTHGGQLWPVHYLVTEQQPVLDGVHVISGVTVVTSRGAGAWGPPVRIDAPPQIPLITLQQAS